jgi:protein arginine N-methyltransferase 2
MVSEDGKEQGDTDMNELDEERVARNLALHLAAADGDLEECKALLKPTDEAIQGADAWWEDESHLNWSALHFAANGGHTDVVKLLLRCGAIWNAVDALGNTAADVCWSLNDEQTYRVLFEGRSNHI